jgi:UDP-glucose 4-epimerase
VSIFVIAGGAGFLGSALAARLGRAGHEVRILDLMSLPASARRGAALCELPTVTTVQADVRDVHACARLCAGADFVLNFAAPPAGSDSAVCADVIISGTIGLLSVAQAADTVRRFVLASSGAVYGDSPVLTRHEASLPDPATPFACALLAAEHFCRAAHRGQSLQTVCLRYFDVYGPGMCLEVSPNSLVTALVRAAVTGEAAQGIWEEISPSDWLYVSDAVEACVRATAAQRGVGGKVFNIGSGQMLSWGSIREKLERLTGHPLLIETVAVKDAVRSGRADTAAAAGLLQFTAKVMPDDGLARTVQWAAKSMVCTKELVSA